jgi:uncharacterized RDD family membrane protein YckC
MVYEIQWEAHLAQQNKPIPTWRGHYAGFASRLIAIIIDFFIVFLAWAGMIAVFRIFYTTIPSLSRILFGQTVQTSSSTDPIVSFILIFLINLIYYVFFWSVVGSTIGGLIMGIRIVNRSGRYPTIFQSIVRFLVEIAIPLLGVIGAIWILFNRQHRALFDMIAGTYVIYNWDARPDETFLKEYTERLSSSKK